jgi:hypothetical protein
MSEYCNCVKNDSAQRSYAPPRCSTSRHSPVYLSTCRGKVLQKIAVHVDDSSRSHFCISVCIHSTHPTFLRTCPVQKSVRGYIVSYMISISTCLTAQILLNRGGAAGGALLGRQRSRNLIQKSDFPQNLPQSGTSSRVCV